MPRLSTEHYAFYPESGSQCFHLDNMTTSKEIDASESGLGKEVVDSRIEYANSLKIADVKGDYSGATAKTDAREITLPTHPSVTPGHLRIHSRYSIVNPFPE